MVGLQHGCGAFLDNTDINIKYIYWAHNIGKLYTNKLDNKTLDCGPLDLQAEGFNRVFAKTCYNMVTTPCASAFDMVGVYNERVQQDTLRQGSPYQAYTHN